MIFFAWLFSSIFNRRSNKQSYYPLPQRIHRHVDIERDTIRHLCAIDSLMTIIDSHYDIDTFSDLGDLELFIDYCLRVNANKKAIDKEESKNLKY